jgi:hypothetical protein
VGIVGASQLASINFDFGGCMLLKFGNDERLRITAVRAVDLDVKTDVVANFGASVRSSRSEW